MYVERERRGGLRKNIGHYVDKIIKWLYNMTGWAEFWRGPGMQDQEDFQG